MSSPLQNPNQNPRKDEPVLSLPVCMCMGPAAGLLLYFLVDGLSLPYCLLIGMGVGTAIGLLLNAVHKK